MRIINLPLVFICTIFLTGCAGTDSYRFSKNTFSMGSNIYLEGGYGSKKVPKDEFSLNYNHYGNTKLKASIDLGLKIGNVLISGEHGRIFNDFKKQVYDETVAGDLRTEEEFSVNTDFYRVSLVRKYVPSGGIEGEGSSEGNGLTFLSLQAYYDYKLKSNFYKLPNGTNRRLEGTAYGGSLNWHIPGFYMGIGFNWRKYTNDIKLQELVFNFGTVLLVF